MRVEERWVLVRLNANKGLWRNSALRYPRYVIPERLASFDDATPGSFTAANLIPILATDTGLLAASLSMKLAALSPQP
jgi:hypothetical protein